MKPIVIYDDKCSTCTAFGTWGKNILPLGYSTGKAKELMTSQFGKDYGFVLMIFTDKKVFWGAAASEEIIRQGYSSILANIFSGLIHAVHPLIVRSLNFILRRKTLPHPPSFKHKKLSQSGNLALTKSAISVFNRM